MLILIDNSIPEEAKNNLALYGQVVEMDKSKHTYRAISSHPDIFYCQLPDNLIIAPNSSDNIINILKSNNIKYTIGFQGVAAKYPSSASYNAVVTSRFLIHNTTHTEKLILDYCRFKKQINVKQAYTRCNLIPLGDCHFITSDMGICNQLKLFPELSVIYINPENILLPEFKNGFFGGCCGIFQNKLFIIGNLSYLDGSKNIRSFIENAGFHIIELYDGPLYDGGSILFIE